MTILDVVVLLIIAGVCGALGQAISGFSRGGLPGVDCPGICWRGAGCGWLAKLGLPEIFAVQIEPLVFRSSGRL